MQTPVERRHGVRHATPALPADRAEDVAVITDALRRITRELRLAAAGAEPRAGVRAAPLHALRCLADRPAMSVSDLAGATHTDVSSVSEVVAQLVEKGLVSRGLDADDHRRLALELTPRGRAVVRQTPPAEETPVRRAAARLTGRQRHALAAGLSKLAAGRRRARGD